MMTGGAIRRPGRAHGIPGGRLAILAALGAVTIWPSCGDEPPMPRPRAVVMVTIDTLRADGLSFQGAGPTWSPFLDSLAAEGVILTKAYAPCSWTAPSMASLFTGYEPASHGVVSGYVGRPNDRGKPKRGVQNQPLLPQSLTTLAESFRSAGYVTIGVPSNLHLAERLGFGQGFDHYAKARFLEAPDVNQSVREQLELAFGPEWKTKWKQEKTFLWIHYFDPHVPYFAREPWIEELEPEFAADPSAYPAGWDLPRLMSTYPTPDPGIAEQLTPLYRSEIRYVDEHLREIGGELGLSDDDVFLIVTSDHGEEFVEHGKFGHGQSLFEEAIHVPLFLRWPDGLPEVKRLDTAASILDVFPTLAVLLNLPLPSGMQGVPIPGLLDESPAELRPMYFHTDRSRPVLDAVREGPWKLIRGKGRPTQLYNLEIDPAERDDVAATNPQIVQRLESTLDQHLANLPAPPDDTGQVPVSDEKELERLRALGYIK